MVQGASLHSWLNLGSSRTDYKKIYNTIRYGFTILYGMFGRTGAFHPVQHQFNLSELFMFIFQILGYNILQVNYIEILLLLN